MIEPPIEGPQIERANVQLRRKVIAGMVAASAVGVVVFWALQNYLESLRKIGMRQPDLALQKATNLLTLTSFALGLGLMAGGLYTLGLARSIHATKRYPPEGMATLRDTRVITGAEAQTLGLLAGGLSILVILGGILIPAFTLFMIRRF